jgi:hypothetical protein
LIQSIAGALPQTDFIMEKAKLSEKRNSEGIQDPERTRFTRARAIRLKCLNCMANQMAEVRKCEIQSCSLWEFRLGSGRTEPLTNDLPVHGRDEGRF